VAPAERDRAETTRSARPGPLDSRSADQQQPLDVAPGALVDPANVQRLSRSIGNRAVNRILARQPASGLDEQALLDPFEEDDRENERLVQALYRRVRTNILELLKSSAPLGLLSRLRETNADVRELLLEDVGFMAAIRARVGPGKSFWYAQLALEFGQRMPQEVRELSLALHDEDPVEVLNLLRAWPRLIDGRTPGVAEVLKHVFKGRRELGEMLAIFDAGYDRARITNDIAEVHYEHPEKAGLVDKSTWELKRYGGGGEFELIRQGDDLRVVASIKLDEVDASDPKKRLTGDIIKRWRDGIMSSWNVGYRATNGKKTLRIVFVPIFRFGGSAMHEVHVHTNARRANQSNWHLGTSAGTAAHEFGHMLGLNDEYRLPATIKEAMDAGLSERDARLSSVEGITGEKRAPKVGGYSLGGIMDDHGKVLPRHVQPIVDALNAELKLPHEAPFRLVPP